MHFYRGFFSINKCNILTGQVFISGDEYIQLSLGASLDSMTPWKFFRWVSCRRVTYSKPFSSGNHGAADGEIQGHERRNEWIDGTKHTDKEPGERTLLPVDMKQFRSYPLD